MHLDRRFFLATSGAAVLVPASARAAALADPEPAYRIPMRVTDRRVLVDCTIGGQGPFPLVFDTGGTIGLITLEAARRLGLKQVGTSFLGLKQGRKDYPIYRVPDLAFAGQVRQPESAIAGVDNVSFGDGAIGSIAAGALTATNGELDFDRNEWLLYPRAAPDRAGWTRVPNGIFRAGNVNGSAFLAADMGLGGRTFRVGLDTGMPAATRIYRRTAERAGLWEAPRWSPAAPGGKGRVVRAPLTLGGATIADAVLTITEDPDFSIFPDGLIGLPILRRFNLATRASDDSLFLKRNQVAEAPMPYNRAGLWIDRDGGGIRVGVVGPGSPAEKAGIAAGDRLSGMAFGQVVEAMTGPAGTVLPLTVTRGAVARPVALRLEDFL